MAVYSLRSQRSSLWCGLMVVALASSSASGAAYAIDAARQSELTSLVRQDCGSCHGMTLKGGLGKPLLPEALEHLDAESIASIILEGVPGQPMPAWKGLLSSEDAAWIAQRLKKGFPK
jgi:cytochrome c55X